MIILLASGLLMVSTMQAQNPDNPREFEMREGDTVYIMKQYFMVLLVRGEQAGDFTEEELREIQASHLAHISKMAEAGKVVIAGPFGDDGRLRGVLIFDVATEAEVEEWVLQDPAVQAGRLSYEIHPWWAAKGSKLP